MNRIWCYTAVVIILVPMIQQAYATTTTTKTYQNFGLGFKLEYPSNMTINAHSNYTTIDNLNQQPKNYFHAAIIVLPWGSYMRGLEGLPGLFTLPNLDTLARQFGLVITDENTTVTNKTKLVVDNTYAYLFQATTIYNHNSSQLAYHSFYLMLKGNVVYELSFLIVDKKRFLPVEQEMIRSFRFI